jgi:hypothetical protein
VSTYSQWTQLEDLSINSKTPNLQDALHVATANRRWTSDNLPVLHDYLNAKLGVAPSPPSRKPVGPPVAPPTAVPAGTPGPGPAEPPSSPSEWRLPGEVAPLHYKLEMVPFLEVGAFTFQGREEITVETLVSTATITLHAKDLDIDPDSVRVNEAATNDPIAIAGLNTDKEKDFLVISINGTLAEGTNYIIAMQWSAPLRTDNFGFYVSSYLNGNEFA